MANTPLSGDLVKWGIVKGIASDADALMKKLVIDPRGGDVRLTSIDDQTWTGIGGGDHDFGNDYSAAHPYLMRDITAPFPIDFPVQASSKEGQLTLRFEFAYYNYGPSGEYLFLKDSDVDTPYKQRAYKKNSRKPILTSVYLAKDLDNDTPITLEELVDDSCLDKDIRADAAGKNISAQVFKNLIESNLAYIHKQYPVSSFYSTDQIIEGDIYLMQDPGLPINCSAIHRLCFAYTGAGDGAHNGNGNSSIVSFEVKGGPHDDVKLAEGVRPYYEYGAITHDFSAAGRGLTLQNREWDYNPEFFTDKTKLYTPPPICGGCVDVIYPKIGLEGGLDGYNDRSNSFGGQDPEHDFNAYGNRLCSFYGDELFELGSMSIPGGMQYKKVCGWDPAKKHGGKSLWTAENYGVTWCQPEDLGAYEDVSIYTSCNVCGAGGMARLTPIRFYKEDDDGTVKKYNFVWAVTAICLPVSGKFTLAIRKRWYDMILYRLMYTVGYWQYPKDYENFIGCTTNDSGVSGPDDIVAQSFTPKQKRSGVAEDPDGFELSVHDCGILVDVVGHVASRQSPVGVSWGFDAESEWAKQDMACARWLWEQVGWGIPDDVKSYCRAYFGARYWESFLASCNEEIYKLDDKLSGEVSFSETGGLCASHLIEGGCGDAIPDWPLLEPWRQYNESNKTYCPGESCSTNAVKTYAYTARVLLNIIAFIREYKCEELQSPGFYTPTDIWKACSPNARFDPELFDWEWHTGDYYTIGYSVPKSTSTSIESVTSVSTSTSTSLQDNYWQTHDLTDQSYMPMKEFLVSVLKDGVALPWPNFSGATLVYCYVYLFSDVFKCYITDCGIGAGDFDHLFNVVDLGDGKFVLRTMDKGLAASGYVVRIDGVDYPLEVKYYEEFPTENIVNNVYTLLSNTAIQDPYELSESIENAETIDDALDAAVRIVAMVSGSANGIEEEQDCEEWHEVDYGDYIYYWCYVYSKSDGYGTLPYKIEHIITECFSDQEYIWAGVVEAIQWPDEDGLNSEDNSPVDELPPIRTLSTLLPAKNAWNMPPGGDKFIMRITITDLAPLAVGMLWCPYLLSAGHHHVKVEISSPMLHGAHSAALGKVRGWVPDHCGPDDPMKHYVACESNYDSIYCPVLTGCNGLGGLYVSLWVAGWERGSNAKIIDTGFLGGATPLQPPPMPEGGLLQYLSTGRSIVLEGDVEVDPDLLRGYIGLTVILCTVAEIKSALASVSNIFSYIMSASDEFFKVTVTAN